MVDINSFAQLANSAQLDRIELNTTQIEAVQGHAKFTSGNIARNKEVRNAFANAIVSLFGNNAKLPLGFRAGLTPLSSKKVKKIIAENHKVENTRVFALRNTLVNIIQQNPRGPAALYPKALEANPAQHDPQTQKALHDAMMDFVDQAIISLYDTKKENNPLSKELTPNMLQDLAETFVEHLHTSKPELIFAAKGLARGKITAAFVNEHREKLNDACQFYAKGDNYGYNDKKMDKMLDCADTIFSRMNIFHTVVRQIAAKTAENTQSYIKQEDIEKIIIKNLTHNIINVIQGRGDFNDNTIEELSKSALSSISHEVENKIDSIMTSLAGKQNYELSYVKELFTQYKKELHLESNELQPSDAEKIKKYIDEKYPEYANTQKLENKINQLYNMGLGNKAQEIVRAMQAHIQNAVAALPAEKILNHQESMALIQELAQKLPEEDTKIFQEGLYEAARYGLTSQIKEAIGLDLTSIIPSGFYYDIYITTFDDDEKKLKNSINENSVVTRLLNQCAQEYSQNHPHAVEFTKQDIAEIVQNMQARLQDEPMDAALKTQFLQQIDFSLDKYLAEPQL
ncbi:MAG: hypothetical protein PHN64_05020 [Desulfovibrionaceae bacterium]|nr:hypothetical protein [Desulfovibrionaceae bacterium]